MPKRPLSSRARSTSRRTEAPSPGGVARALVVLVRAYRLSLGCVLPPSCRFAPSCSVFAIEAIERHGALRGGQLALRRLARCHPWHLGGYDPVPPAEV